MIDELLVDGVKKVSHVELIDFLNQDLPHEYLAVIAYVVYSQVLNESKFMHVAGVLEEHVVRELNHALILGEQIDYLAKMVLDEVRVLSTSKKAIELLQLERNHGLEIIRNYSERITQCEYMAEYAISE